MENILVSLVLYIFVELKYNVSRSMGENRGGVFLKAVAEGISC